MNDLPTEDKQLVALALAELSLRRPGWFPALSRVAHELACADAFTTLREIRTGALPPPSAVDTALDYLEGTVAVVQRDRYLALRDAVTLATGEGVIGDEVVLAMAREQAEHYERCIPDEDVDQIIEGIEHFIIEGFEEVRVVWQPYIDRLRAMKGGGDGVR